MTAEGRYPYFGVPPKRQPRPAVQEPALTGKRLILSTPDGFVYDMRASGEVEVGIGGEITVPVVTERQYFAGQLLDEELTSVPWPAHLVWVE